MFFLHNSGDTYIAEFTFDTLATVLSTHIFRKPVVRGKILKNNTGKGLPVGTTPYLNHKYKIDLIIMSFSSVFVKQFKVNVTSSDFNGSPELADFPSLRFGVGFLYSRGRSQADIFNLKICQSTACTSSCAKINLAEQLFFTR